MRLGRLFNAEILGLLLVLSYVLATDLNDVELEFHKVLVLFIAGVLAHVWGCYNNDRKDFSLDREAKYCSHKPLVSGKISLKTSKMIEYIILTVCVLLVLAVSPRISTAVYWLCAIALAYLYNRFNKSSQFINVIGQMYGSFVVLTGMSVVVDFDTILVLSAAVIGLNGVYLNIIEADLKDVEGDIVNVPKALGVRFNNGKARNAFNFYLVNETIKLAMAILVVIILYLEDVNIWVMILAGGLFLLNLIIRQMMFINLTPDREKLKPYFAAQELSSILFISTIYMIVHPLLPVAVIGLVAIWLVVWNLILWGKVLRSQV